jgi:hypothetical protein
MIGGNMSMNIRQRTNTQDSCYSEFEDFDYDCYDFGKSGLDGLGSGGRVEEVEEGYTSNHNNNSVSLNDDSMNTNTSKSIIHTDDTSSYTYNNYNNSHNGNGNHNINHNHNNKGSLSMEDCQSSSCDLSVLSMTSCSSRSFVTDDNLPTLRLDTHGSDTSLFLSTLNEDSVGSSAGAGTSKAKSIPLSFRKRNGNGNGNGNDETNDFGTNTSGISSNTKQSAMTYTLQFPIGEDIGLQFKAINIDVDRGQSQNHNNNNHDAIAISEESTQNHAKQLVQPLVSINRSRSFSDSTAVLKNRRSKAKLITFDSNDNNNQTQQQPQQQPHQQTSKTTAIHPSNSKPGNIFGNILSHFDNYQAPQKKKGTNTNKSKKTNEIMRTREKNEAIFVYDFKGFDTSTNVRPTLGARLIAIDDESLLPHLSSKTWTVSDVHDYILKRNIKSSESKNEEETESDGTKEKRTFTLTFRNDVLTKDQKEELMHHEDKLPSRDNEVCNTFEEESVTSSIGSVVNIKSCKNLTDGKDDTTSTLTTNLTDGSEPQEEDTVKNMPKSPARGIGKAANKVKDKNETASKKR